MTALSVNTMAQIKAGQKEWFCGDSWGAWATRGAIEGIAGTAGGLIGIAGGPVGVGIGSTAGSTVISAAIHYGCTS